MSRYRYKSPPYTPTALDIAADVLCVIFRWIGIAAYTLIFMGAAFAVLRFVLALLGIRIG